jgi:mevalonate kinase
LESVDVKKGVNLVIRSDIPSAVGLGSSAAICVATVAAVAALVEGGLSMDDICSLAYEGEKIVHGTPSGVDNNISTFGGIIKYEKGVGFERLNLQESPPFIIGNTRRKRSTKKMVENVAALRERSTRIVDSIIDTLGDVSSEGLSCLLRGDLQGMGELMNIGHGLLSSLGVSSPQLDLLVYAARYEGALGAKLTGAGGGGCMIALADDHRLKNVEEAILRERGDPIRIKISHEGVKTRKVG